MSEPATGPTLPPPVNQQAAETNLDGKQSLVFPGPSAKQEGGKQEFGAGTDVYYVNGINTDFDAEIQDARAYATEINGKVTVIHAATDGMMSDLRTVAAEKMGIANNPPEQAVQNVVLSHIRNGSFHGDVHFMAHSRGALIVQRGLEMAEAQLVADHLNPQQVKNLMSHVSVETIGGASTGMPAGVRCVNYVNTQDSVANVFGQGKPSMRDLVEVSVLGQIPVFGFAAEAKIDYDHYTAHPNGPVIAVPPVSSARDENQFDNLIENHGAAQYLRHRKPFEAAYGAWEKSQAPAATHTEGHASTGARLEQNIGRLGESGVRLPSVTQTREWAANAASGSFVHLDDQTVALHAGRGMYLVLDVERDLRGVQPPEGQFGRLSADGQFVAAQPSRDLERSI